MKKVFLFIITFFALLVSCDTADNNGFPDKISFPAEGGSKIVSGDGAFYALEISTYNGNGENISLTDNSDSICVKCKWLTVKAKRLDNKFELIADPKTDGKSRKLYIDGYVTDTGFTIKVTQ